MQMTKHFTRPPYTSVIQYQQDRDRDWSIWGFSSSKREEVERLMAWLRSTGTYKLLRSLDFGEWKAMEDERKMAMRMRKRSR